MVKAKEKKIRFWYGIFLSVYSVIIGVLFVAQTWSIYRSAPQSPYTVESIATHFRQIAIPVWLWVAAIVGNILLAIAFPEEEKRPKADIDAALALDKTKKSLAKRGVSKKAVAKGNAEARYRLTVNLLGLAVVLLGMVLGILILFGIAYKPLIKTEFFTAHDGVVDKLFQCVLITVVVLATVYVTAWLNTKSRKRERAFYLQEMAKTAKEKAVKGRVQEASKKQEKDKTKGVWLYRAAIFAVALVLLIVGICNGGMKEVFVKAINICTQCIGLG